MQCLLSQAVPRYPVVAPCGCLFEQSLIEKYIDEHHCCPITGEPLQRQNLIAVKAANKPQRSGPVMTGAATVPALLERLNQEWEVSALETFTLRNKLAQMGQELSMALNQYEAACRVIASLKMECEVLKQQNDAATVGANVGVVVPPVLLSSIDQQEAQHRERRKNLAAAAKGAAPVAPLMKAIHTISTASPVLSLCIVVPYVYTGGMSSHHELRRYALQSAEHDGSSMKPLVGVGHNAAIHTITATTDGSVIVTASEDHTVRVWHVADDSKLVCDNTLRYPVSVTALSRRMIADRFIIAGCADGSLFLSDIRTGVHVVVTAPHPSHTSGISCIELHPFSSLAALGTRDGQFVIFNVRTASVDTTVQLPSSYAHSLDFAEDYRTAVVGLADGRSLLWDLKQLEKPTAVIAAAEGSSGPSPSYVRFRDGNTQQLAVICASTLTLYDTSQLAHPQEAVVFSDEAQAALRGLCCAGGTVATGSTDGTLRLYSA